MILKYENGNLVEKRMLFKSAGDLLYPVVLMHKETDNVLKCDHPTHALYSKAQSSSHNLPQFQCVDYYNSGLNSSANISTVTSNLTLLGNDLMGGRYTYGTGILYAISPSQANARTVIRNTSNIVKNYNILRSTCYGTPFKDSQFDIDEITLDLGKYNEFPENGISIYYSVCITLYCTNLQLRMSGEEQGANCMLHFMMDTRNSMSSHTSLVPEDIYYPAGETNKGIFGSNFRTINLINTCYASKSKEVSSSIRNHYVVAAYFGVNVPYKNSNDRAYFTIGAPIFSFSRTNAIIEGYNNADLYMQCAGCVEVSTW